MSEDTTVAAVERLAEAMRRFARELGRATGITRLCTRILDWMIR